MHGCVCTCIFFFKTWKPSQPSFFNSHRFHLWTAKKRKNEKKKNVRARGLEVPSCDLEGSDGTFTELKVVVWEITFSRQHAGGINHLSRTQTVLSWRSDRDQTLLTGCDKGNLQAEGSEVAGTSKIGGSYGFGGKGEEKKKAVFDCVADHKHTKKKKKKKSRVKGGNAGTGWANHEAVQRSSLLWDGLDAG